MRPPKQAAAAASAHGSLNGNAARSNGTCIPVEARSGCAEAGRPKRTCWADMLSDEESDGEGWGAASTTAPPSAEPSATAEDTSVAGWAADLQTLSEQLRALAARAPPAAALRTSARSAGLCTELTGDGLRAIEAAAARLRALQLEEEAEGARADSAVAEAEAASAAEVRCAEAAARAALERALAEQGREAEHRRQLAARDKAATSLAAARAAAEAAALQAQLFEVESQRAAGELQRAAEAAAEVACRAREEFHCRALAERRVRELPQLRAQRASVEQRAAGTQAECEALRRAAEQLRAGLEAPTSAGAKAEFLEVRIGGLEHDCRELQSCLASADADSGARSASRLSSALALAQEQNRRLAGEVRDARAARDEVKGKQPMIEAELVAARWQADELARSEAQLHDREAEIKHEVMQHRVEISELELSIDRMQSRIARAPEYELEVENARREELEACRHAAEEERQALRIAEELRDAKELEFEDKSERLKAEIPYGTVSRCLYSAKSKAAKTRGPWARTPMR